MQYSSIQEFLDKVQDGSNFSLTCIIGKIEKRKSNGSDNTIYLLTLVDLTGSLVCVAYRLYQDFEDEEYIKGHVFTVEGNAHLKNGNFSYVIKNVTEVTGDVTDFIPKSRIPIEKLIEKKNILLELIEDKQLLIVAYKILDKYGKEFYKAPAAAKIHHNYMYGLLEHSVNVATLGLTAATMYETYNKINKDLVIIGGLFHDIGKIQCYKLDPISTSTSMGKILDHIVIGYFMIRNIADTMDNIPNNIKDHLYHIIVSHHGKREYGSPVEPMTCEAEIVAQADMMDSQVNAIGKVINEIPNNLIFSKRDPILNKQGWAGRYA